VCARKEIFFLETSLFFFSKFESLSRVNGGLDGWKSAISPTNRAGKTALCSNVEKKSPLFVRSRAYNKRRARSNFEQIYMTWFFFPNFVGEKTHSYFLLFRARNDVQTRDLSRRSLTIVFSFNPGRDISSVQFVRFERAICS